VILQRGLPDLARALALIEERGLTLGRPLHVLDETTSTNDEAKRAARSGAPHGAAWVAESQTAGRGRQGRAWVSPRGENLLFSVLLRVTCPPSRLPPLALVVGLAARDAVARAIGSDGASAHDATRSTPDHAVRLKWPNDVVVGPERRKVAGVLVEAILQGRSVEALVVGVGINVHTRDFPGELAARATSVSLLAERAPDRAEILADVLTALDRDLELVAARGLGLVHARLTRADALRGARVQSEGSVGVAEGIDLEGRLLVRKDDGLLARWGAGEVHLVA
jgi:BirA family biotin operon repressor/biotin-[acetyl-CoA-carboxylase] ligase